jgi:hypothetical protein
MGDALAKISGARGDLRCARSRHDACRTRLAEASPSSRNQRERTTIDDHWHGTRPRVREEDAFHG